MAYSLGVLSQSVRCVTKLPCMLQKRHVSVQKYQAWHVHLSLFLSALSLSLSLSLSLFLFLFLFLFFSPSHSMNPSSYERRGRRSKEYSFGDRSPGSTAPLESDIELDERRKDSVPTTARETNSMSTFRQLNDQTVDTNRNAEVERIDSASNGAPQINSASTFGQLNDQTRDTNRSKALAPVYVVRLIYTKLQIRLKYHSFMYVCMYVCMYVYMYVCVYVCM